MTYNPTDIYTLADLNSQTTNKIIEGDIVIRGEYLKILEGVSKINGFLGISDSIIESLGELQEITGDFWTSFYTVRSPLISLSSLEKIGGDASFRYSNIVDLGNLKYVGGKLSLRDTNISDLGKLQYIGGDLYLPERLKDNIELANIHVFGKIQFWTDNKNKPDIADKSALGLTKSTVKIPYWAHQYIFSKETLKTASIEQKNFYSYFKTSFLNDIFIDLCGNDNYSFILFFDLIDSYYQNKHLEKLEEQFSKIEKHYPKTGNYTSSSIIEELEKNGDYKNAWQYKVKRELLSVQTIWEYEQKLNAKLLDGDLIVKLGGYSHLTDFGQNNIELIKPFVKEYLSIYEAEHGSSFFELFFDCNKFFKSLNEEYTAEYYLKYYLSEVEFYYFKAIDDSQITIRNPNVIRHVVEKAILNQCRLITKKGEDLYRAKIGMPKIGEGWISETELFYKIAHELKEHEVIHQGKPGWLGRQHIDIYLPNLNIGIEYQGLQHYEPVDFFGGREALEKNKERDENKRRLCCENNCILIYVNEKYIFEEVIKEIKQKIQTLHQK